MGGTQLSGLQTNYKTQKKHRSQVFILKFKKIIYRIEKHMQMYLHLFSARVGKEEEQKMREELKHRKRDSKRGICLRGE